jgi:hypothetical protein
MPHSRLETLSMREHLEAAERAQEGVPYLRELRRLRDLADRQIANEVAVLRTDLPDRPQVAWEQIGEALGLTRQGAAQRYGRSGS